MIIKNIGLYEYVYIIIEKYICINALKCFRMFYNFVSVAKLS